MHSSTGSHVTTSAARGSSERGVGSPTQSPHHPQQQGIARGPGRVDGNVGPVAAREYGRRAPGGAIGGGGAMRSVNQGVGGSSVEAVKQPNGAITKLDTQGTGGGIEAGSQGGGEAGAATGTTTVPNRTTSTPAVQRQPSQQIHRQQGAYGSGAYGGLNGGYGATGGYGAGRFGGMTAGYGGYGGGYGSSYGGGGYGG